MGHFSMGCCSCCFHAPELRKGTQGEEKGVEDQIVRERPKRSQTVHRHTHRGCSGIVGFWVLWDFPSGLTYSGLSRVPPFYISQNLSRSKMVAPNEI